MAKETLPEQRIKSNSIIAIVYRNINRHKVDKLFSMRDKSDDKNKKKLFDFLARQKWRKIIRKSNEL